MTLPIICYFVVMLFGQVMSKILVLDLELLFIELKLAPKYLVDLIEFGIWGHLD